MMCHPRCDKARTTVTGQLALSIPRGASRRGRLDGSAIPCADTDTAGLESAPAASESLHVPCPPAAARWWSTVDLHAPPAEYCQTLQWKYLREYAGPDRAPLPSRRKP